MAKPRTMRSLLTVLLLGVVAAGIALAPPLQGADERMMLAAALTLFSVGLWATAAVPEYVAALLLFAAAMITAVAPANVVFSAFHSSAIWLVFGGLVLGVAADRTGVGRWIANRVVARTGRSYRSIILGITIGGMILGFLIPSSMGRLLLLYPIVRGLAKECGFDTGTNGLHGLLAAMILGAYIFPATILPANVPNVILLGMSETLYQQEILYSDFALALMPVFGVVKVLLGLAVIFYLFPARVDATAIATEERVTLSRDGRILFGLLCITLLLWMTDSLHGVSPGWISLVAAALCLLPGLDFVPADDFQKRVSFGAIIYVAGTIAVGAIISTTGLDRWLGANMQELLGLTPGNDTRSYFLLMGLGIVMSLGLTMGGLVPVLAPLAADFAAHSGLPLFTVLMIFGACSGLPLLPYQSGPVVLALRLAGIRVWVMARWILPLGILSLLLLVPLNWVWWRLIGLLD